MANAISFACPTVKVYQLLPPCKEDLDEVLAFIFTGIKPPTDQDLERTPMLVRRNKVASALEWLKLNHCDYADLQIDYNTLQTYPESGVPVKVVFRSSVDGSNNIASATSMHETAEDEGNEVGPCPFKVNGLIGANLEAMTMAARRASAIQHIQGGGNVLAVGHSDVPESIYDNPQLYPQMYPWLFPYGSGGIGNARLRGLISEAKQKKILLMYHDKRFQKDCRFVIVAFNHEQIRRGTTSSFILAKRRNFDNIVSNVARVNPGVLQAIATRLREGERVIPCTEDEKLCFSLMDQIDHVGVAIQGSLAGKKNMRSELWSLIINRGAPCWFATLSPVDHKHPICLYWAGPDVKFTPDLRDYNERVRLIAGNPVAGARFFHFMVTLFIRCLLRWNDEKRRPGIFGSTSAYYGTVEQQGRMTLHLHMLIWVTSALTPQEVRDRLLGEDSEFKQGLVAYLESCHQGEFINGSLDEVRSRFSSRKEAGAPDLRRCCLVCAE
ncbi:hypothetical protein EST38_g11791 [Candolleomyces aberdarensis]|uniref:Uncharacterized protein n=1 Tax=Candolleomyces aberdarensis TaxID=2316362 RepID=A0A4Q2D6N0_9AGAR|nr:hypothetical protein EST38_g11791 [Candolleomyces aberdarensis]